MIWVIGLLLTFLVLWIAVWAWGVTQVEAAARRRRKHDRRERSPTDG